MRSEEVQGKREEGSALGDEAHQQHSRIEGGEDGGCVDERGHREFLWRVVYKYNACKQKAVPPKD